MHTSNTRVLIHASHSIQISIFTHLGGMFTTPKENVFATPD
uniref:Uncharacterized protein n=1 Tax=Schistosoma curassoni TaxID=6186 RepID=A0A183JFZ5_9TREM